VDPSGEEALDIAAGFSDALSSNLALGLGRDSRSNDDFMLGQALGDATSILLGARQMVSGLGLAGAGLAAEGPSLGTSTTVVAAGAAVATHGSLVASQGLQGLVKAFSQRSQEGPEETVARQKGDRFRSGDDPLQQYEEIEAAQQKYRQGKSDQIIDSTEKSRQRAKNFLKKIRKVLDVEEM
jgi:hypothetical protein